MLRKRNDLLWGGTKLAAKLDAWQQGSDQILYGGLVGFVESTAVNGGTVAGGRTFIDPYVIQRVRQDGYIRQVVVDVFRVGPASGWKFKIFRPNGSNFDFVSESEFLTPAGTGVQTINLATPMACQPGDVMGVWLQFHATTSASINVKTSAGFGPIQYDTGDISSANWSPGNSIAGNGLDLKGLGIRPYLAVTGDSLPEGHNGVTPWHSYTDSLGPAGNLPSEIMHELKGLAPKLKYQNHARGSQTYAWVASTGIGYCVTCKPHTILILCGVNDVAAPRLWGDVQTDLNTIVAAITTEKLLISEILPWTNGSDAQAATIRTWNGNLAAWCTANGAKLIMCHDAMGKVRVSTGMIDDLGTGLAAADGLHLSQLGVDTLAAIWEAYLLI